MFVKLIANLVECCVVFVHYSGKTECRSEVGEGKNLMFGDRRRY